ncbi:hypothetical protein IRI77_27255 [Paludibaculum fermentans]|uniref:Uncharacterized protein n=1 Tax=Paludibaculum fermentans TaxID=1473598 RepID=A0A7S7NYK3_PALFE|nr:hypothetical protein IRI77_27255 [Paludibaculum fermentans]
MPAGFWNFGRVGLGDELYQEILTHPIPTDLEAVKLLAAAPAVLDLFMWLTYPCFTAKRPEAIPIFGEFGIVSQLGSVQYSCPRRFRAELGRWLFPIRVIWPECPARVSPGGFQMVVAPAFAVHSKPVQLFGEPRTHG